MSNLHIRYYGINTNVAKSIVGHKRIIFCGYTLNDDSILKLKNNQCYGNKFKSIVIYVSLSIKYAKGYSYDNNLMGKKLKIFFQCKNRNGTIIERMKLLVLERKLLTIIVQIKK